MRVTYNPLVFEQSDLDLAKAIILTPEDGRDPEQRWRLETPYLAGLIGEQLALAPGRLVLDYGCGIGRMAKALIERYDVKVLGVDISQAMRTHAPAYVASPAFSVVSNDVFAALVRQGLKVDAAVAIWVLQHCPRPAEDIVQIRTALPDGGPLFVLNNHHRAVPTLEVGWADDQVSVRELLGEGFVEAAAGAPDGQALGTMVAAQTFWGLYRAKSHAGT